MRPPYWFEVFSCTALCFYGTSVAFLKIRKADLRDKDKPPVGNKKQSTIIEMKSTLFKVSQRVREALIAHC